MNISKILQENIKFLCEEKEDQALSDSHNESIDLQVYKKFIEFEKNSQTSDQKFENFFYSSHNYLFEEEEEKSKESDDSESQMSEELMTTQDIDLNQFTSDVVRLIENFSNLIEIRDTVVRRALKFLAGSYDEEVLKLFEETLKEEFGIEEDKTVYDQNYEVQPSRADRAGPSGAG
jgi:hypothetical protein